MNKQSIKNIVWALVPALIVGFSSCSDDKKEDPAPAAKTLNKTTLTNNKTWYSKGGSTSHPFKTGGVYGVNGTWNWVRNSDTMEISAIAGDPKAKWKFNWNTDTDMECEWIGNGPAEAFKTTKW